MDTIRIMSVGRSGVGKSTIGNMFLLGNGKGRFKTSMASTYCTERSECRASEKGDIEYVDVPGIPCTDPKNNAKFYDIMISEAKKELNVILFVFKRGKEDYEAYKLAEVLFRELNKCNTTKILVINDFTSYDFDQPPAEADFNDEMERIKEITKIDFTSMIAVNGKTMPTKLTEVKNLISEKKALKSEHLRNFTELGKYVDKLRADKCKEDKEIRREEQKLNENKSRSQFNEHVDQAGNVLGLFSGALGILSLLSVAGALPIAVGGALGTVALKAFSSRNKTEQKNEEKSAAARLDNLRQRKAEKAFKTVNKEFEDLKKVLNV